MRSLMLFETMPKFSVLNFKKSETHENVLTISINQQYKLYKRNITKFFDVQLHASLDSTTPSKTNIHV